MVKLINNASFINYAFNQLSKDPIMESLINSLGHKINPTERYNRNYALAICNLIIEQQISFKAAITIKNKFKELISGLSNSDIIKLDNNKVQSIGLSFRKVEYMKNVLIFLKKITISSKILPIKVFEKLISIKGVGKWTCEMFLILFYSNPIYFHLGTLP